MASIRSRRRLTMGWGRHDDVYFEKWFHSDMKDMAYYYVYPLYDELTTKGNLK